MLKTTIILIVLAFFLSSFIAWFHYFFREKAKPLYVKLLFTLRCLGLFFLFILFINPKISIKTQKTEKPILNLLIDNSKSIDYLKQKENILATVKTILDDNELSEKFEINAFQFAEDIILLDSLTNTKSQTNIANSLIELEKTTKSQNKLALLLSDGNQTFGVDYKNYKSKTPIYPIVFGDTTKFDDIYIQQVNVNKYTYLDNEFPVEVFVSLKGNSSVTSNVSIKSRGKLLSKKQILLTKNSSKRIEFVLSSKEKGNQFYTVEVSKLKNEKNLRNNTKNFAIETIDEKSKTLLISNILHPDIGTLKRSIQSNKKRTVIIKKTNDVESLESFQSIILYQPDSQFDLIFKMIKESSKNVFIITGGKTDYDFLNGQNIGFEKNTIPDIEKTTPIYNSNFLPFQQEDIGFENFPPLKDVFGEVNITGNYNILLNQRLNGIETNQPLLLTISNNFKTVILFGEGIWQWRSSSFLSKNSFESFDNFINNIIQYINNNSKKNRLEVEVNPIHFSNQSINFSAYFFDENFQFDKSATLKLYLKNLNTEELLEFPFSNMSTFYSVKLDNIDTGTYEYTVKETRSNIMYTSKLEVLQVDIESQFINANLSDLNTLANNSNGKIYFPNQVSILKESLLKNSSYKGVIKFIKDEKSLLEWWHYLLFVITCFSSEWLLRKYHGKI